MTTVNDLQTAAPGDTWTAEHVRLIGDLFAGRVSGSGVYQDGLNTLIDIGSGDDDTYRYVLLREVLAVSKGDDKDQITAQRLKYKNSSSDQLVAYGANFNVFPMLGHDFGSYKWLRSVFPLIGELKDETLNSNAFFAYKVVLWHGRWMIEHLPRMFENTQAVDANLVEYSGGGGTS